MVLTDFDRPTRGFRAQTFIADIQQIQAADDFDRGQQRGGLSHQRDQAEYGLNNVDTESQRNAQRGQYSGSPPPAQRLLRNEYKIRAGRHARQKMYAGDNPKAMPKSHTEALCIVD